MENVLITDEKRFKYLKEAFKEGGPGKIHVLADFDRTLNYAFVNGKKIPSLISVLRDENYLTPEYPAKANALYEKYHAIEMNPDIPKQEKKEAMKEWWTKHFKLLIESGLDIKDIDKATRSNNIVLREGAVELFGFLKERNIPLVILSSSGLGIESIEFYLKNKGLLSENVHIISNSFEWDDAGKATAIKQPIIHTLNKDKTMVKDFPGIFQKIKDRKNVILLGDSVSDAEMVTGFEDDNIIKIGFLNEGIEENMEDYKRTFDVLIIKDSSIDFLNNFLKEIIE